MNKTELTVMKSFGAITTGVKEIFELDPMSGFTAATPYTQFEGFVYSRPDAQVPDGLSHLGSCCEFGGENFCLLYLPCETNGQRAGSVIISLAGIKPKGYAEMADFIAYAQEVVLPRFLEDNKAEFKSVSVKTVDVSDWKPKASRFQINRQKSTYRTTDFNHPTAFFAKKVA